MRLSFQTSQVTFTLEMAPDRRTGTASWPVASDDGRGVATAAIRNIEAAVACTKDHAGTFQLGVRPFDDYEEFEKWWPSAEAPARSKPMIEMFECGSKKPIRFSADNAHIPTWLVMRDGGTLYAGCGYQSREQLSELMHSVMALTSRRGDATDAVC